MPDASEEKGSFIQLSCMRVEAKHELIERLVTQRNNYKIVPRTIGMNNEINLASTASGRDLFTSQIQIKEDSTCATAIVFENDSNCF